MRFSLSFYSHRQNNVVIVTNRHTPPYGGKVFTRQAEGIRAKAKNFYVKMKKKTEKEVIWGKWTDFQKFFYRHQGI